MIAPEHLQEVRKVLAIPIVPTLMEVCCQATGAGFCAIARVTEDNWICCSVRDGIGFGMQPGDELVIEKTFCNTVRQTGREVVFNSVQAPGAYNQHPIALLYEIESYISVPIYRRDGSFFGTLCALDRKSVEMETDRVVRMFRLFAELISFHLETANLLQQNADTLSLLHRELASSRDEIRQYQYISNHNLLETLRKMRVFSSMLMTAAKNKEIESLRAYARKLNNNAQRFSMMLKDLTDYSALNMLSPWFEPVSLQLVVETVIRQLQRALLQKKIQVNVKFLPTVLAIPVQMEQLFQHLVEHAISNTEKENTHIHITADPYDKKEFAAAPVPINPAEYWLLTVADEGRDLHAGELEKIFDLFNGPASQGGMGVGLAYCKKIIQNHRGFIDAIAEAGKGTTIRFLLPRLKPMAAGISA